MINTDLHLRTGRRISAKQKLSRSPTGAEGEFLRLSNCVAIVGLVLRRANGVRPYMVCSDIASLKDKKIGRPKVAPTAVR